MHHGSRSGHKTGLADVVAFFFFLDDLQDELSQCLVGRATAHQFVKVVIPTGE